MKQNFQKFFSLLRPQKESHEVRCIRRGLAKPERAARVFREGRFQSGPKFDTELRDFKYTMGIDLCAITSLSSIRGLHETGSYWRKLKARRISITDAYVLSCFHSLHLRCHCGQFSQRLHRSNPSGRVAYFTPLALFSLSSFHSVLR